MSKLLCTLFPLLLHILRLDCYQNEEIFPVFFLIVETFVTRRAKEKIDSKLGLILLRNLFAIVAIPWTLLRSLTIVCVCLCHLLFKLCPIASPHLERCSNFRYSIAEKIAYLFTLLSVNVSFEHMKQERNIFRLHDTTAHSPPQDPTIVV